MKMHSVVSGVILMMQPIFSASKSPNILFQTDDAFINICIFCFRLPKLSETLCRYVFQGVITNIFKLPSIAYFSGFICVLFEVNSYYMPV
uniref:Putative ovule protein n=1 Tax=Solanum chacoense TaxID=4108 RepID=A0A0V0HXL4_SOLCH